MSALLISLTELMDRGRPSTVAPPLRLAAYVRVPQPPGPPAAGQGREGRGLFVLTGSMGFGAYWVKGGLGRARVEGWG